MTYHKILLHLRTELEELPEWVQKVSVGVIDEEESSYVAFLKIRGVLFT